MQEDKSMVDSQVNRLLSGDAEMWSTFLFNVDMARALLATIDTSMANNLLQSGVSWNGSGWNTGSCSKKLWEQIQLPLVQSDFTEYRNTWLFALALSFQIEIPQVALSDRAADVAFRLMEKIVNNQPENEPHGDGDEEIDLSEPQLAWEDHLEQLPKDLAYLWAKAARGERLDLVELLDEFPKFKELPSKAPENNHRSSNSDKALKIVQQGLLHALRILATAYQQMMAGESGDGQASFQIAWKQISDTYQKAESLRKEASMPGSTSSTRDQLFTKEDMSAAALTSKIRSFRSNRYKISISTRSGSRQSLLPLYSFRISAHRFSSGIRNSAKGKGKGGAPSFKFGQGGRWQYGKPLFGGGKGKSKGKGKCARKIFQIVRFVISQDPACNREMAMAAGIGAKGIAKNRIPHSVMSSSQIAQQSAMVAAACAQSGMSSGIPWRGTRFYFTCTAQQKTTAKSCGRNRSSKARAARVRRGRSRTKSGPGDGPASNAVVRPPTTRLRCACHQHATYNMQATFPPSLDSLGVLRVGEHQQTSAHIGDISVESPQKKCGSL